jgi:hypothetical protein
LVSTQRLDATAIEDLTGRSVRSRPIIDDAAFEAHATLNVLGELRDRDVVTSAHIDVRVVGIVLQKMHAGVGEIIDIEKLAAWSSAAPDDDLGARASLAS